MGSADNEALLLKEERGMGSDTLCQVYLLNKYWGKLMKERSFLSKTLLDMNRAGVLVGLSPRNNIAPTSISFSRSGGGSPRAGRR